VRRGREKGREKGREGKGREGHLVWYNDILDDDV
tara:strand:- start:256 stop:357 length:102 start_codon:yes stop_codon:yes gene_type:complete